MKRTTYIMIGLFTAGLIVLIGGFFLLFFTAETSNWQDHIIQLEGDRVTKELPTARVLWLDQEKMITDDHGIWIRSSCLDVLPAKDGQCSISYNKEVDAHVKAVLMGDTLKLTLSAPWEKLTEKQKKQYLSMDIGDWEVRLPQGTEAIVSEVQGKKVVLKELARDSLSMDVSESVVVEACDFKALHIRRCGRSFEGKSGNIGNLHLDLGRMHDWSVDPERCKIDTEYLTGHDENVTLAKGECRRMFWTPENEDSKLKVTLTEKSSIIVGK